MDVSATGSPASNWRDWMVQSKAARQLGVGIAVAASVGVVAGSAVMVALFVRGRPLDGVVLLLLPGVPTLAVGQLWLVGWGIIRQPRSVGSWRSRLTTAKFWPNPREFFFGPLNPNLSRVLLGTASLGWLSAMTAFPAIIHGGPAGAGGGCPYRLRNHGSYTCVSQSIYDSAGAGEQRFSAGILMAFFAIHLGAALGGRKLQDQTSPG